MRRVFPKVIGIVALLALGAACRSVKDRLPGFPALVLSTQDKPDNLTFIEPDQAGVAYLAKTIYLQDGQISSVPRTQPLQVGPSVPLIAIVRIEHMGGKPAEPGGVSNEIAAVLSRRQIRALQIDFEASDKDRGFYANLLQDLHQRIPPSVPVEITAAPSWCGANSWLKTLPITAAVPLFYRGGNPAAAQKERLAEPLCRSAIGIASDQVSLPLPEHRRVFVFQPQPWTEAAYQRVRKALGM
jgi:hypothetical protein